MADWETLHARWRCLRTLEAAAYEIGPFAQADEKQQMLNWELAQAFESIEAARQDTEALERLEAGGRAVDQAMDDTYVRFATPTIEAAIALVMAPAPDAEAVEIKYEAIKHHELDNYQPMPRDPFDIEEDVCRFTAME